MREAVQVACLGRQNKYHRPGSAVPDLVDPKKKSQEDEKNRDT